MKKLLSATAALAFVALTAPANAADLPVKAPPMVMPALYNWTGLYVGVEGGGVMGQTTHWTEIEADNLPEDIGHPLHGGFVGGEAGINWQVPGSRWVFGIEGDGNWAELEGALTCDEDETNLTCGSRIRFFATARGRIGYALGPTGSFLVYLTGGGAWASQSYLTGTLGAPFNSFEQWKTTAGGTGGIGAEYGITPYLSLKGEVLYVGLAGKDYPASGPQILGYPIIAGCDPRLINPGCQAAHIEHSFILARMGLNWRFWWGKTPTPVVARY